MNRLRVFLIIIFGLVTCSMFVIYTIDKNTKSSENFLKNMIKNEANSYYKNIVEARKWNSIHGGVYVKKNANLKSSENLKDEYLYTSDGEVLVKINPSLMIRQISEISNKLNDNFFKITSLNPLNSINAPDDFERRGLFYFNKNKEENIYTEYSKNLSEFNFIGSLKVSESCLSCHRNQDFKLGEIRGGIRVSIPTKKYYQNLEEIKEKNRTIIFIIIVGTMALILGFKFILDKLDENSDEIEKNLENIKQLKDQKELLLLRYEYAIEGTKDGLWDWNLETNSVFYSKNWKNMLGYKNHEIENKFEEWDKRVHPDDKEQAIKDIENNHKKLTSFYQNIHRMKHKNGTWVWILDRGKTYFNENGEPYRMVGFHSDITELKNLEISLKKTKNELTEFKFIIESAPITIMITDINGDITYVNPHFTEITGYEKNEVIGKKPKVLRFNEHKNKEDDEKYKSLWRTILDKKTWGGIFRNRKKNGSEYWETATILPILNNRGEIQNYLGIKREITKELFLEKQLKEKEELMLAQSKNAAMGEMISMIAHQWRQPITAISMSANNIIADIELEELDSETTKKVAKNIADQTQYLSKTIDDFRNFFKEDKTIVEFKIKDFIKEIETIMLASLKNNSIDFVVNLKEDITLSSYKSELLQVFINIIKNAKEALVEKNVENKFIQVDIEEKEDEILISVLDNGGGIEEENLSKIFTAYFSTKNDYNGTGLGLYMSKIIIEKHLKGSIFVRNKDKGANFVIRIKKNLKE